MTGNQTFCGQCGTLLDAQLGCAHCCLAEGLDAGSHDTRIEEQLTRLREVFPAYDWKERVGQGGMGVVYRAVHRRLERTVAIKVLNPELEQQAPDFGKRFEREARTMASLAHPGLVTVHDFGLEQGFYVLFMEFVEGATLRQVMRDGSLQPDEALDIVHQICDALEYAHERGVVHRDIKPENILIDERGHVKITDFGLARLVGDKLGMPTLTRSQQVMGTPHYMAPEQMSAGSKVDHRADIFSLGVVFYELLTGKLPVGRFPPPSVIRDSDPGLDEMVMTSLEPDPDARYQDVMDLRRAVHQARGGASREAAVNGSPSAKSAATGPDAAPARAAHATAQGGVGPTLLGGAYTLVAMLCIAGFAGLMMPWYRLTRGREHPADDERGILAIVGLCLVASFVVLDWFGLLARREHPEDSDTISYSRWMDRLRWPFFALGSAMASFGCATIIAQETLTESGEIFAWVSLGCSGVMLLVSQTICLRPLLGLRAALSLSPEVAQRLQWAAIALCVLGSLSVFLPWDQELSGSHRGLVDIDGVDDSRALFVASAFLSGIVILCTIGTRKMGALRFVLPLAIGAGTLALCAQLLEQGHSGPMAVLPIGGALGLIGLVVVAVGVRTRPQDDR